MNLDQFWKIIDASRSGLGPGRVEGHRQRQLEELRGILSRLPPHEILDFRRYLLERMDAAFQWDLWGAAYLLAEGCSDDGFADFRSWLISMGRRVFEAAVSSADSLVDIADSPGVEDLFFEEFQYVPAQVYERLTGHEPPVEPQSVRRNPTGEAWNEEDLGMLQKRLPGLWARSHPN